MPPRFLDTNILLRYLTRDDETKAEQALALLLRIEQNEEKAVTSPMVIFETVFTLQRFYQISRERIGKLVLPIVDLRGLQLANKHIYHRAFELYISHNVSFADAYNAAHMQARQLTEIYSWDRDFDRIPGITRVEPGD